MNAQQCLQECLSKSEYLSISDYSNSIVHAREYDVIKAMEMYRDVNQSDVLLSFLIHLNNKGLINNHDFDYEKESISFVQKKIKRK